MKTPFLQNLFLDLKSHSGLTDKAVNPKDGANFDVILTFIMFKNASQHLSGVKINNEILQKFRDSVLNDFMINQHKMIAKHKHFNWNY